MIKRCDLFRNDSVHGAYKADIDLNLKEKCLTVNGQRIYFIEGKNPSEINYNKFGINDALLIDNSEHSPTKILYQIIYNLLNI